MRTGTVFYETKIEKYNLAKEFVTFIIFLLTSLLHYSLPMY